MRGDAGVAEALAEGARHLVRKGARPSLRGGAVACIALVLGAELYAVAARDPDALLAGPLGLAALAIVLGGLAYGIAVSATAAPGAPVPWTARSVVLPAADALWLPIGLFGALLGGVVVVVFVVLSLDGRLAQAFVALVAWFVLTIALAYAGPSTAYALRRLPARRSKAGRNTVLAAVFAGAWVAVFALASPWGARTATVALALAWSVTVPWYALSVVALEEGVSPRTAASSRT